MQTSKKLSGHLLLVEDDPDDVLMTRRALERSNSQLQLDIVRDGAEAIAFLKQEDSYSNALRPDMILLDLNLPKKNGREVLAEIRKDESLKDMPVAILTTSNSSEDIHLCYKLSANCYLVKPEGARGYDEMIDKFTEFWFHFASLPGSKTGPTIPR